MNIDTKPEIELDETALDEVSGGLPAVQKARSSSYRHGVVDEPASAGAAHVKVFDGRTLA
jgi:hypothetical protein